MIYNYDWSVMLALHIAISNKKYLQKIMTIYKTISDGGITVDFSIIKVHTSN